MKMFHPPVLTASAPVNNRALVVRHLGEVCSLDANEYQLDLLISEVTSYLRDDDGLRAQSDLVAFLYTFDRVDSGTTPESEFARLEDAVAHLDRILEGRAGPSQGQDGYGTRMLHSLCRRIRGHRHYPEFVLEMKSFLRVTLLERDLRQRGTPITAADYFAQLRDASCAVGPCALVAYMYHPQSNRDQWRRCDLAEEVLLLCRRIISVHNDVFGFRREQMAGDVNNYVTVLAAAHGESRATELAVDFANNAYARFVELRHAAKREQLDIWWQTCDVWISGNWTWSTLNTRRFAPNISR